MRKIPTLFIRDPDTQLRYVRNEVHPDCKWVLDGEGVATRKYDGTCVMLDEQGAWWARREVKPGKSAPAGWVLVEHDEATGKSVGWEPIEQGPFVKLFNRALAARRTVRTDTPPGTYELCGPKVNGNPEGFTEHVLIRHADAERLTSVPRGFDGLRAWLADTDFEGIVWHHPDGRMAKLKARDFPRGSLTGG